RGRSHHSTRRFRRLIVSRSGRARFQPFYLASPQFVGPLRTFNMPERLILMIGTKKGVFVAQAPKSRRSFTLNGPSGPGVAVYATLIDKRGTPRLYASSCNAFFGMKVLRSTDLGKKFKETKSAPSFPKDDGRALANIWSLEPGYGKKDLFCGVEPASLFR